MSSLPNMLGKKDMSKYMSKEDMSSLPNMLGKEDHFKIMGQS